MATDPDVEDPKDPTGERKDPPAIHTSASENTSSQTRADPPDGEEVAMGEKEESNSSNNDEKSGEEVISGEQQDKDGEEKPTRLSKEDDNNDEADKKQDLEPKSLDPPARIIGSDEKDNLAPDVAEISLEEKAVKKDPPMQEDDLKEEKLEDPKEEKSEESKEEKLEDPKEEKSEESKEEKSEDPKEEKSEESKEEKSEDPKEEKSEESKEEKSEDPKEEKPGDLKGEELEVPTAEKTEIPKEGESVDTPKATVGEENDTEPATSKEEPTAESANETDENNRGKSGDIRVTGSSDPSKQQQALEDSPALPSTVDKPPDSEKADETNESYQDVVMVDADTYDKTNAECTANTNATDKAKEDSGTESARVEPDEDVEMSEAKTEAKTEVAETVKADGHSPLEKKKPVPEPSSDSLKTDDPTKTGVAEQEEYFEESHAAQTSAKDSNEKVVSSIPDSSKEDEEDRYDFPEFPAKRKKPKKYSKKAKKLKISIRSVSPEAPESSGDVSMEVENAGSKNKKESHPPAASQEPGNMAPSSTGVDLLPEFSSIGDDMIWPDDDGSTQQQLDQELEDSLLFFRETHEEQDPAYITFIQEREEQALKQKLAQLETEDAAGRQEIDEAINTQSKEKQALTNRNIEKYKVKAATEEKRDTQRLMQLYNDKMASNQGRIDQGIKILTRRHSQEMQNAMNQHRQQFQNQQQSPQAQQRWNAVAQQLQNKQQRQMQEFRAKGEEMKKKSENDFKTQQEKLKNQYQQRLREIEASRRKVFAKIFNGFQQLRQRYLKRHSQKIAKKKETLMQNSEMVRRQLQKAAGKAPEDEVSEEKEKRSSDSSSSNEKEEFLRPPSPVKTSLDWVKEELLTKAGGELSGASVRHKQRKSVLSQLGKQLSVEIHNEGLWISTFTDKNKDGDASPEDASNRSNTTRGSDKGTKTGEGVNTADGGESKEKKNSNDGGKSSDTAQEKFIPWGVEAHTILQSIICGEIPRGYHFVENGTDYGDALSVQGGHIRCVVTDLRTNENTASAQRAAAIREQEESNLQGLEQKIVELSSLASEAETTLSRAEAEEKECRTTVEKTLAEFEKAKKIQQEFRTKFGSYLGSDGNPLPTANPNDRQELAKAIMRYKSNLEAADSRHKSARSSLNEARARTQKMQAVAKHAQKAVTVASGLLKKKKATNEAKSRGGKASEAVEMERAAGRVKDVIAAFHKTAEKRRDQLNQKRNSSASSTWVQSLPGLPGPLKKSLWHKMHRRRQQIVLRPSLESLTSELRDTVEAAVKAAPGKKKDSKAIEEEQLRAEQSLYLAMHPVAPEELPPSVPPSGNSSESWAEPGWQLVLDVPKKVGSTGILPCAPSFPIFSKNLAELSSAPGRQAAAFSRTSHLHCLASNLSAVATATSLAETNPSVSSEVSLTEGDPLNITAAAMSVGYAFYLAPPPKPTTTTQKRKSSTTAVKELASAVASAAESTKKQEASRSAAAAAAASSASETTPNKKTETKKRRSSKSSPSPRVTKRKSTASDTTSKSRSSAASSQQHQPQPAAIARAPAASPVPAYNRQQTAPNPAAAAAAAAQYNQYMKHQSPPQPQQPQQPNYQLMQQQQQQQHQQQQQRPPPQQQQQRPPPQQQQQRPPPQQQQQRPPPQQQQQRPPPQQPQYGSPQQRQMAAQQQAQLRMMQQQQQANAQSRGQPVPPGYPQQQRAPQGMPQQFFNPMGQAPGGQPQYQMPMQGMPQQGMQGMPQQGMPQQGMPQQGMPQQGMPQQGMPQQGMPQQGMPQGMPMGQPMGQPMQPPNMGVPPQQQQQQQNRNGMDDSQNDPLFMLK